MAARLMPTDPQRIVRALEVLESTGRSLADWQRQPGQPVLAESETVRLLVLPDRDSARRRASTPRFEAMLADGALEEVRALLALGLSDELPVMRALGVAPLAGASAPAAAALEAAAAAAKAADPAVRQTAADVARRNMISWRSYETQQMERIDRIDLGIY